MSDHLRDYRCLIEGEITLDSTAPHNTSGAFCDLFTATHPTAGRLALKRPRGNYEKRLLAHIEIEARVWASLQHPRILQFLGIHKIGDDVYLVSAFAENGSLPEFLEHRPEVDRKRLIVEVAEGLAYLHQRNIIHGDLKGNNVLISNGEHVLLCDFGLAKHVTSRTSTSLRGAGSIPWQSPELLQDEGRRTVQSDVYAFGITVYEVLSGKEPYAHHTGIIAIITGVFSGERPPKEPEVALDGSSYLQFWDEASRCWDQAPSARPRIVDVLRRLDRRRAEMLITSQQRVLEESLIPPTQDTPCSQLSAAPDLSSSRCDETNQRNTLEWAHQIRARMNTLVNAQQPLCRFSREIIVMIIKNDLGPAITWNCWRNWRSSFDSSREKYSNYAKRCAQLGMVCRAWRDAVDNTPELTRYIFVNGWRREKNIEYVQRNNCDGPVEALLENANLQTRNELSSLLGPLAYRLSSVNIGSTNVTIEPAPFPMLRAIRIHNVYEVPYTFASDLLGVLHANQGLVELYVGHIHSGASADDPPRLRIDHPSLQRVQLTRLSPHILSPILHCLGLKSSVMLIVDEMRLEHVRTPGSATGDLIRSLQRTAFSAFGVQFAGWSNEQSQLQGDATADNHGATVMFRHTMHNDNTVLHWGQNPGSRATSEWIQLESGALNFSDVVDMVRFLRDSGIEPKSARLAHGWDGMPVDLLHYLSPVTRLLVEGDKMWSVLQQLGQPLPRDPESTDEHLQFLCPNLTVLDLKLITWYRIDPNSAWSKLRLVIQNRRTGTHVAKGHAKLQRIGLQRELIEEHDFSDPVFEGIEIYELPR